jgi:serine/threonine protein phosphatase PrpC
LILACDGVWDEIEDQMAVDIVAMEKERYQGACRLRDYAYLLTSEDNISVIIVDLKH